MVLVQDIPIDGLPVGRGPFSAIHPRSWRLRDPGSQKVECDVYEFVGNDFLPVTISIMSNNCWRKLVVAYRRWIGHCPIGVICFEGVCKDGTTMGMTA